MAFEVETGTGSATATSFTTEAFADAWAADHPSFPGASTWAAEASGDKQASLIEGTQALGTWFGLRLSGRRQYKIQALDFPREGARDRRTDRTVDIGTVPVSFEQATAILAIKHRGASTIVPLVSIANQSVQILREKVKIGPLEFDDEFSGGGKLETDEYEFDLVCSLVEGLLLDAGAWIRG